MSISDGSKADQNNRAQPAGTGRRPEGVDDATVEACGKLSEALEYVERARGHLYSFHQLLGHADQVFAEAAERLGHAGYRACAELVQTEVVGRNVLHDRWTYQVVEEFDDHYHQAAVETERQVRQQLMGGVRHVYESELKAKEQGFPLG